MRRGFGQALRVGVTDGALALAVTGPLGAARLIGETAYDSGPAGALPAALQQLLGTSHARWPVSYVVSDDLARMWSVTPPQGAARMTDLQAAAALRFHGLYGDTPAAWAISADWDAVNPFMAAAMPRALVDAVTHASGAQRMAVTGIETQFVIAWNAWRASLSARSWFALVHEGVLSLGVPRGSRLGAVRVTAIPGNAGPDWLASHVEREALLLDAPVPASLALCGAVPTSWLQGSTALECMLVGRIAEPAPAAARLALAEFAS